MHLSSSMSSITESERCKTSYLSAGLVDTVFGYQKEIIQLRQEQGLVIAKGSGVIKQNERLKQQKLKNTERIKLLETEKERVKMELGASKIEIFEHRKITSDLVFYPIRGRPIPNDVLLKCKHLIDAEDQIEANL